MDNPVERNLGEQPLGVILARHGLSVHDVVAHSREQITHKMVSRGVKGRRLSRHVQLKILRAVNAAAKTDYSREDIFDYS